MSGETEGGGLLTVVHAIEDLAVMEDEAWIGVPISPELSQHEVEAEELHLLYALAALTLDVHVEREAASGGEGYLQGPVAPFTLERTAVAVEESDRPGTDSFSLVMSPPTMADHLPPFSGDLIIGVVDLSALTKRFYQLVTLVPEIGQALMKLVVLVESTKAVYDAEGLGPIFADTCFFSLVLGDLGLEAQAFFPKELGPVVDDMLMKGFYLLNGLPDLVWEFYLGGLEQAHNRALSGGNFRYEALLVVAQRGPKPETVVALLAKFSGQGRGLFFDLTVVWMDLEVVELVFELSDFLVELNSPRLHRRRITLRTPEHAILDALFHCPQNSFAIV